MHETALYPPTPPLICTKIHMSKQHQQKCLLNDVLCDFFLLSFFIYIFYNNSFQSSFKKNNANALLNLSKIKLNLNKKLQIQYRYNTDYMVQIASKQLYSDKHKNIDANDTNTLQYFRHMLIESFAVATV